MNDIELAYQKIMLKAKKEEELDYNNLYTIYICSSRPSNGTFYFLSTSSLTKKYLEEKEDFIHGDHFIDLKTEIFTRLIDELKTSIQKGELDDQIHLTENHIIYNKIYKEFTQKPEPITPLVAARAISEGELVQYICSHCHSKVQAYYHRTNQPLLCLYCMKYFNPQKTSFTRA